MAHFSSVAEQRSAKVYSVSRRHVPSKLREHVAGSACVCCVMQYPKSGTRTIIFHIRNPSGLRCDASCGPPPPTALQAWRCRSFDCVSSQGGLCNCRGLFKSTEKTSKKCSNESNDSNHLLQLLVTQVNRESGQKGSLHLNEGLDGGRRDSRESRVLFACDPC